MTKLKTRMAGITAATMTAAALTATAAAPAMAETTAGCELRPIVSTASDVAPSTSDVASITVVYTGFRAGLLVAHDGVTTTLRYQNARRNRFVTSGAAQGVDTCGVAVNNGIHQLANGNTVFWLDSLISPVGSDLVFLVAGTTEQPLVTVLEVIRDTDGDGVRDEDDRFPNSVMTPTVVLGGQDTGVTNTVSADGATIADLFGEAMEGDAEADKKATAALINSLDEAGVVTKDDAKALASAVKDMLKVEKKASKA